MSTTVIHHSADYDGLFCREIARRFMGSTDTTLIGWDYGDPKIPVPIEGDIYILDLSPDALDVPYGELLPAIRERMVWIDHHKSAIIKWEDQFPQTRLPGYRIDGVSACRLAWQWFTRRSHHYDGVPLPSKLDFIDRKVSEPEGVRLAGEYDVWDHRDGEADVAFQFGLDSQESLDWEKLLGIGDYDKAYVRSVVQDGWTSMRCYSKREADIMRTRSFVSSWHGLTFLVLNTARCTSKTFAALDVPETGHDALMGLYYTGKEWSVSMYHANHRRDIDLSQIAAKFGGGGHRGACGFRTPTPPFIQCV